METNPPFLTLSNSATVDGSVVRFETRCSFSMFRGYTTGWVDCETAEAEARNPRPEGRHTEMLVDEFAVVSVRDPANGLLAERLLMLRTDRGPKMSVGDRFPVLYREDTLLVVRVVR